jgi:hypothetical protein
MIENMKPFLSNPAGHFTEQYCRIIILNNKKLQHAYLF